MPTELEIFKDKDGVINYLKDKYPDDPKKQKKLLELWEKAKGYRRNRIFKDIVTVAKHCGKGVSVLFTFFLFMPETQAPEIFDPGDYLLIDPETGEISLKENFEMPKCEGCDIECCPCIIEVDTQPCED